MCHNKRDSGLERGKVVFVNSIYTTLIKEKLYEYSNHPFLNKFFDLPEVSEDKIILLQAILDQTDLKMDVKEDYIMVSMLIQTALDAHELVSNDSEDNININKNKRQKQLNILVGDLYSGLFYEILSHLDDIPMINVLAGAIKEINERKMILYKDNIHSINQLMEEVKSIESLLLNQVASHFDITSLDGITENWLLMKRLVKERDLYQQNGNSFILDVLTERIEEKDSIRMLENMITRIAHILETYIVHLPSELELLKSHLLHDLKQIMKRQEILLEEG